ncbi:sugar ABC transporter permease [Alicyclobacillus fastidiosus]|uniref:Sugar ABC transporter permease n=1 Tax=Alicyclobacillus fastidiosus TaxID=392011 RepID=A0ABY6ZF35_9BACL|nr:sugar ABC transporter permease [Alicyclobacillus fastidiosus]WAH41520.1 sugar ABC transporter permease [Alicyclobacillus fastidiosus]GMA63171.1 spermidine/putrescine ABC transporter permease [Alicyclobacillus fastidiosus]
MSTSRTNLRGIRVRERKALLLGLLFASPWILGFLIFQLYPIVISFYYSLTNFQLLSSPHFIGFKNYYNLFHDQKFYQSLYNTIYITVLGFIPQLIFALLMALLLNLDVKGKALYRTVFFLPTIVPLVASSLLWMWLLNGEHGLVNDILGFLGIGQPAWLADPKWTKPALILMGFWGTGTATVMYLAALQDVPKEYYEAAAIDGAGPWNRFFRITFPSISPMTLFQLIMGLIGSFQYFTQAYVFANDPNSIGGPGDSMLFYATYLYQQAFTFLDMGYASAMAWVLFAIVIILTLVIFRTSARWVFYGGEK